VPDVKRISEVILAGARSYLNTTGSSSEYAKRHQYSINVNAVA